LSSSPATDAKSSVLGLPRVPRTVLPRPRISAVIAGSLATSDLVVLRSTGGSGKTVALADWAASGLTSGHISWVTMDTEYSDRTSFWREMILGTELRVDPTMRLFIRECSEALLAGADPRTVLRRFVPYVPQTVLVIDKLDAIEDSALFDDMIWALKASRNIKVVAATRRRTPFDDPALALEMDIRSLGPETLHLTLDETVQLLEMRGYDIDPAELHQATAGHPLLTRATLAVYDAGGHDDVAACARAAIADLLTPSLTGTGLSHEMQDFMVRTSIPESFSEDLARKLCSRADVPDLLSEMEDRGLGLRFTYRDQVRFRYAAPVRAVLTDLRGKMDPRETDRLTRIVIDTKLSEANIVGAIRLAFNINDLDLASAIACDHHLTLLVSQAEPVREILESVPLTRLRRHPALIMALALCYNSTSAGKLRAIELFGLAAVFARMFRSGMDPAQRMWTLTMESAALRFAGKLEPALKQAETAVQSFEESPLELRERLAALEPTLYTQAGIAFIHDRQLRRASQLLSKALSAGRRVSSLPAIFLATGLLAFALALDGNITECLTHLQWLDEARWPPGMAEGYWATTYRLAQVRAAMDRQDYQAASGHLAQVNEEMRDSEFWPYIVSLEAYLDLQRTGPAAGPATLESRIRRADTAPVNSSGLVELDRLRASIFLIAGQPVKAAAVMDKYKRPDSRVLVMRARIALYRGQPARTLTLTGHRREGLGPRLEVGRLLLRAAALRRLGDMDAAFDNARAAAVLMDQYGLTMTAALVPQEDLPALTAVVKSFLPEMPDPMLLLGPRPEVVSLTPREQVVLQALAVHGTVIDVAAHLNVSVNTVKSQSRSINKKLGAASKEEALNKARRLGLLDD
jgi:LuxR family transcriptional regulator, maltose regulon positive regulatory protein